VGHSPPEPAPLVPGRAGSASCGGVDAGVTVPPVFVEGRPEAIDVDVVNGTLGPPDDAVAGGSAAGMLGAATDDAGAAPSRPVGMT
jgi:hypothetical protein